MPDYKEKYNGLTVSAITAAELRNSRLTFTKSGMKSARS